MLVYFITHSHFVQGIWARIASALAGIGAYALYILIALLGIALILGAVGSRPVGRTSRGFINTLSNIIGSAIKNLARGIVWLVRQIARGIARLWRWLYGILHAGFLRHVSHGLAGFLAGIFTFVIMAVVVVII